MTNCVFHQLKAGSRSERKKFKLDDSVFEGADLAGTAFLFCELKAVSFQKANLENAVFERCNLKDAVFINASISGANFSDSKIENTKLDVEGFIALGTSKGFKLEQMELQ